MMRCKSRPTSNPCFTLKRLNKLTKNNYLCPNFSNLPSSLLSCPFLRVSCGSFFFHFHVLFLSFWPKHLSFNMFASCLHNTYIHLNLSHLIIVYINHFSSSHSHLPYLPFLSLWILNLDPHILFVDSHLPFCIFKKSSFRVSRTITSILPEEREKTKDLLNLIFLHANYNSCFRLFL